MVEIASWAVSSSEQAPAHMTNYRPLHSIIVISNVDIDIQNSRSSNYFNIIFPYGFTIDKVFVCEVLIRCRLF